MEKIDEKTLVIFLIKRHNTSEKKRLEIRNSQRKPSVENEDATRTYMCTYTGPGPAYCMICDYLKVGSKIYKLNFILVGKKNVNQGINIL